MTLEEIIEKLKNKYLHVKIEERLRGSDGREYFLDTQLRDFKINRVEKPLLGSGIMCVYNDGRWRTITESQAELMLNGFTPSTERDKYTKRITEIMYIDDDLYSQRRKK